MKTEPVRKQPFRSRGTLMAALGAILALGFSKESERYQQTLKVGCRHGKHNGRCRGAFGRKASLVLPHGAKFMR